MVLFVSLKFADQRGAGTHQAHISLQDIEKLREFINAGIPDKLADTGLPGSVRQDLVTDDSGVKLQLKHQGTAMAVLGQQFFFPLLRIHIHTAEFIHLKPLAVLANALLGKENGTGRADINGGCHKQAQKAADQAAYQAAGNVHGTLQESLFGGGIVHTAGEHRVIAHLLHDLDSALHMGDLHQTQMHRHTHFHKVIHQILNLLCGFRQVHKNLIHPVFLGIGSNLLHFRNHRDPIDFGTRQTGLHEDQTGNMIHTVAVIQNILNSFLDIFPGAYDQQGTLSLATVLLQYPLPENTG